MPHSMSESNTPYTPGVTPSINSDVDPARLFFYLSFNNIFPGESLPTPRFTQRWPQLLGNNNSRTRKRRQQAHSSHLRSGAPPQPSTYSVKTNSELSFNKHLHSKPRHSRHRRNRATNNFHSTVTISSTRIKLQLRQPLMDTSRHTAATRGLEKRVARVGSV